MLPVCSLIFLAVLSLAMLTTDSLYDLINYTSFVESLFQLVSVAGLLYLRWKRPNLPRPVKVSSMMLFSHVQEIEVPLFSPFAG